MDVTSNLRRWSGKNGGSGGGNGDEIAEYVKIVKSYAEKNKKMEECLSDTMTVVKNYEKKCAENEMEKRRLKKILDHQQKQRGNQRNQQQFQQTQNSPFRITNQQQEQPVVGDRSRMADIRQEIPNRFNDQLATRGAFNDEGYSDDNDDDERQQYDDYEMDSATKVKKRRPYMDRREVNQNFNKSNSQHKPRVHFSTIGSSKKRKLDRGQNFQDDFGDEQDAYDRDLDIFDGE